MDKNNWENICQNINGGSFPVGTGLMGGFYFYLWASLKQIGLTYITRKKCFTHNRHVHALHNFL